MAERHNDAYELVFLVAMVALIFLGLVAVAFIAVAPAVGIPFTIAVCVGLWRVRVIWRQTGSDMEEASASVRGKTFTCPECGKGPLRAQRVAPAAYVIRHCHMQWRVDQRNGSTT